MRRFQLIGSLLLVLSVVFQVAFTTASALASGRQRASAVPTIPCGDIIGGAPSGSAYGYRIILGVVSVPPPSLRQVIVTPSDPWPYWRKAGLVIRGTTRMPVVVSVPTRWRNEVAITWGGNTDIVSSLRFAPCPSGASAAWNAYAGGFCLRRPSLCVPLTFQVGQRSATVRFGLGRPCSSGA